MDSSLPGSQVKILFFAKTRELSGVKESKLILPAHISYQLLLDTIISTFGLESVRENLILAINQEYIGATSEINLKEKDEIAVNMAESKNDIKLQKEVLKVGDIVNLVVSPNCGAITTFSGTTRDNFQNKKVIKLEYEAYESMAIKEILNICSQIRDQWNVERIAIHHRLGVVPVTEASVVIAISSPHRQDSLEATRYAIDMLKASVPIWKKEIYDTEDGEWKENKECSWSASHSEKVSINKKSTHTTSLSTILASDQIARESMVRTTSNIGKSESSDVSIDPNLVQIRASSEELTRRIEAFIARKRAQVNLVNVQEFCCHRVRDEEESSCARVDAILIRRKDSKSHVRVHRVLNSWGPQTVDPLALQRLALPSSTTSDQNFPGIYPSPLEERLATNEINVGIYGPVPKDVYERLKRIEERILYLESVSPEYKHFWTGQSDDNSKHTNRFGRKRTFSRAELDTKLHELENKYAKRSN